jgi:hypothetical protein
MTAERPSHEQVRAASNRLGVPADQYAAHLALLSAAEASSELARVLSDNKPEPIDHNVVYGEMTDGSLVFIPEARARVLAEVCDAWWHSDTWGELRERLEGQGLASEFLAWFDYPDNYPPDDEELTDDQKHQSIGDGDWPAWPGAEQLQWMPQDVIDMGDTGMSMVSGPALWFEPEQADEVVAALNRHGFTCRRDDALVIAAHSLQ